MTASMHSSAARGWRLRQVLALFAVLCAMPSARADEVPPLRQGLWEYQRTAGTQKFAATECIDPSEDLRRQHASLERMGCKMAPVLHNATTYTYTADCALKLPPGVITLSTTTVLTADSDSAYRLETRTTSQGATNEESITGRRVGDCAP